MPGIDRGIARSTAGRVASSFKQGICTINFIMGLRLAHQRSYYGAGQGTREGIEVR